MRSFRAVAHWATMICLVAGAAIVLIQSFWITYGVFVRYALGNPDSMVTEATALLLVPLAFLGLPWALQGDAFPRVEFLYERLPPRAAGAVERIHMAVMALVGGFFAIVAVNATISTYRSGASSSVLEWPEYLFWTPVAFAAIAFVIGALYRLISGERPPKTEVSE